MLDPRSFDELPEEIVRIFQELEDYVISDICRRLREEGSITATAEIRISSLLSIGMSDARIRQAITKALGISEAKLEELYQAAAKESQRFDREVYQGRGQESAKLEDNDRLKTAIRAQAEQTKGEFDNFTGSLGFSIMQAGKRVFLPVSEGYRHALNRAQVEIISGINPLEAMKKAVRELAKSGLRTVDYASGRHDQLDVAVRRATVTGLHQVSDKVSDEDVELFESPLVEVSAHGGARDTGSGFENHKRWQGKVYYWREKDRWGRHDLAGKYPDFVRSTGYGDVRGFGGANCRHSKRVFVEGVSQRMYTDQQLHTIDKPPFAYQGVTYTAYQVTQRQRELERLQRQYRRMLIGYEAAGITPDDPDYQNAAIRLQVISQEYKAFSAAAGLPRQPERAQVEGFGREQAARARGSAGRAAADQKEFEEYRSVLGKNAPGTFAEFRDLKYNKPEEWNYTKQLAKYIRKYPNSSKKYFDVQEALKAQGIKKGTVLPPVQKQVFILPTGKHDPYHIMHRMSERGITDDEVRGYMKDAKIMFVQWGGQRQMFVSDAGISVITKDGEDWIYKTAWKKNDNDEDTDKIMEAINHAGL